MTFQTHAQSHERNAMKPQPKWQDWSLLVLAGILFISPWLFGTTTQTSSSWSAWIVGVGFVLFTLRTSVLLPPGAYANQHAHEGGRIAWWQKVSDSCQYTHIANEQLVVGAWLIVAPWILGFAAVTAAAWPASIAGILIVVLAAWKLQELRGQ